MTEYTYFYAGRLPIDPQLAQLLDGHRSTDTTNDDMQQQQSSALLDAYGQTASSLAISSILAAIERGDAQ